MPHFDVTYELRDANGRPYKVIEADSLEAARERVGTEFADSLPYIAVAPNPDLVQLIPKASIALIHVTEHHGR
jgi:hypothetical protein